MASREPDAPSVSPPIAQRDQDAFFGGTGNVMNFQIETTKQTKLNKLRVTNLNRHDYFLFLPG